MEEAKEPAAISATPILDSGVLPPHRRPMTLINLVVGFLVGIIPGVLLIVVGKQANDRLSAGADLLSFLFALALAVMVHELGHLLAGWAVGFRFSSIQVGPLSLRIEHGVLRARFRLEMPALGYAGMHVGRLLRLRRRMLIYVAAGPTANLLSVPIVVLLMNNVFPQLGNTWVATPAAQFAFISLLLGVLSLIPLSSLFFSDGARIALLLRSLDRTRRWLSLVALGQAYSQGVRAKLWKRTWLSAASSLSDRSLDTFGGNWLAYTSASDRKDAPIAAGHLEKCLELVHQLPRSTRDIVAQEAAVFTAWFRDDTSLADRWSVQLKKPKMLPPLLQLRLDVALRCAHRDYDAAEPSWRQGLAYIERATAGVARERLRDSWLEWREEIQQRKTQPSVVLSGVI